MLAPAPRPSSPRSSNVRSHVPAPNARNIALIGTDPESFFRLAERAIDAAQRAGAGYADARITRVVQHRYSMNGPGELVYDEELVGIGVRALVGGVWGFASSPELDLDEAERLAQAATAEAKTNAVAGMTPVELAKSPAATGTWQTPISVDPFTVSIEEKLDYIAYWKGCAAREGIPFANDGLTSSLNFVREEQVLVTSEGTRIMQTRYQTGGQMNLGSQATISVKNIETRGTGWELFENAKILEQFPQLREELRRRANMSRVKSLQVGRYTLVCDGAVMAAMLDQTLGVATQLDRARGEEANATGTSYLNDPLGMLGQFAVGAPLVNVSANRSAPAQLATVKWDDEGVEPTDTLLVRDGVLTDFQTSREQATLLAPYYTKAGRPIRSNGHATAASALSVTLQNTPNLTLVPARTGVSWESLIANIADGIAVTDGGRVQCDVQNRNGLLFRTQLREIKNGRLGAFIDGGGISFNSLDFWKHLTVLGNAETMDSIWVSQYDLSVHSLKGEPGQRVSYTVSAPAATITNQIVIDPRRRA